MILLGYKHNNLAANLSAPNYNFYFSKQNEFTYRGQGFLKVVSVRPNVFPYREGLTITKRRDTLLKHYCNTANLP